MSEAFFRRQQQTYQQQQQPAASQPREPHGIGPYRGSIDYSPPTPEQQQRQQSQRFYSSIGYAQYGGKYQPFTVPSGYRVKSIAESSTGLNVAFESVPPVKNVAERNVESVLRPSRLPVPRLSEVLSGVNVPQKGIAETLMSFTFVPLLQRIGFRTDIMNLTTNKPQEVRPFAGIAGLIAPTEALVYSVGKVAGYKTPDIPPTLASIQAEKALAYGPQYAAATLISEVLLSYGISRGFETVFPGLTQEVAGYPKAAVSKIGGVVYERAVEPKVVAPLSKLLLGEESYFYGTAIEGQTPYELLRLGITKQVTAPLYHGVLETLPEGWANVVMFTKSVVAPNIRNLGSVLQYNLPYQTLHSFGQKIVSPITDVWNLKALGMEVSARASITKGGLSFIWQTSETADLLKVVWSGYVERPISGFGEAYGSAKGAFSFVRQAPSETSELLGKVWSGYVQRPLGMIADYGQEASFLARVRLAQVEFKLGEVGGKALLPFTELGTTAKTATQTVLMPPLKEVKVGAQLGMGSLRYWMPVGIEMMKMGVTNWFKPILPAKAIEATRLMKPFNYAIPKTVFPTQIFEQAKTLKTGITPKTLNVQVPQASYTFQTSKVMSNLVKYAGVPYPGSRQKTVDVEDMTYMHYPSEGFGVSRLAKADLSFVRVPSLADMMMSVTDVDLGIGLDAGIRSAQSLRQDSQQLEQQMQEQQQKQQQILKQLQFQLPQMELFKVEKRKGIKGKWARRYIWEFPVKGPKELLKGKLKLF